jgi:Mce-associated membrane protein
MSSESGSEPTPDAPGTDAGARRGVLALVLGVLVLALLVPTVILSVGAVERHRDDAARTAALAAARQTVQNFVSISASSIDRDLERVTAGATGEFADEFDRGKAQVKSVVVTNKVSSKGSVLEAALVPGADRDSASALVVVDATVTNVSAPKGQLRHYRIRVDLVKVSDAWRVTTLKFVG